jgi:Arm domain-containing DNA-binding protein
MLEGPVSRRIKFTDRSLKAIKPPAKPRQLDYFDDSLPGFGLRVSYNGRKSWIVLYRCNGVKGRLTLAALMSCRWLTLGNAPVRR